MQIELTKEQYKNLIKLVYLGNWMINGIHSGRGDDPQIEKYNEIEKYIFSFAKNLGLEEYLKDISGDRFFSEEESADSREIRGFIDDYDNDTFWQELPIRLGERDFQRKYSKEEIMDMNQEERFLKEQEFIIKYEEEFEKYGIDRLKIEE